jgi:hypothetical protein
MGKGRNYLQCKGTFYKYCIPPLSTITLRDLTRSPVNRYALQSRGGSLCTPSVDDDDAPRYYGWKRKNPHRLSNAEFAMRSVEAKMRRQAEEEARRKQEEEQLLRRERGEEADTSVTAVKPQDRSKGRAWSVVSEAALQRATVEAELDRWLERSEEPACIGSGAPGGGTGTGGGPFRGRPAIPVLRRATSPEEGMTSTDTEDDGGRGGTEDDRTSLAETAHSCLSVAAVAGIRTAGSEIQTAHSDAAVETAGLDSGAVDYSDGCPAKDIVPESFELPLNGLSSTPPEPTADKVAAYVSVGLAVPLVACPLLLTNQLSYEPPADPEGAAEGSDGGSDTLELPAVILLGNGPPSTGAFSFEQVVTTGPARSAEPAAATEGDLPHSAATAMPYSATTAKDLLSDVASASEDAGSMPVDEHTEEEDDGAGWSLSATAARLKQQAAAETERAAEAEKQRLRVQAEVEQERMRAQAVEEAERQRQRADAEAEARAQAGEAARLKAQQEAEKVRKAEKEAERAVAEEAERARRAEEETERAAAEEAERVRRAEEEDEEYGVWSLAAVAARLRRDQPPAPATAGEVGAAQLAVPVQALPSIQPPLGAALPVVTAQSPPSTQPAAAEAEPVQPTQAAQPAQQKPPAAAKRSRFDEVVPEEEQRRTYPRLSQHSGTVGGPPAQPAAASAPPHPLATQQAQHPAALAQRSKASRPRFGSTDDVGNPLVEQQGRCEGDSAKKQKLTSGNLRTLQSSLPPSTGMRARSPPRSAVSPPRSKYGPAPELPPRHPYNPQLEALGGVSSPSFGLAAPQRQPSEHSSSSAPAAGAHKSRFGSAEINFEYNELDDETSSDDGEPNPTRKRKGGLRKAKLPLAQQTTGSTNAEGISRKRPPIYFDTSVRFETIPPPAGTGDSIAPVDISTLLQGGSDDEFGRRRAAGGGNGRRRDSDRGLDRDGDRGVDGGRESDREKQRDWDRGKERDRDGKSGRDRDRDREAAREREWDRDSRSNGDSSHRAHDRDRDRGRERDTDRGRDNDRGRERSRETNYRDRDREPDRGRGDSRYYSGSREPARRSPSPPPARTRRSSDEALNTSVPWSMDRTASTVSPQSASTSTAAPLPASAAAPRLVKRTKQYTDMWGAVHLMEELVEEPPTRRVVTPAAAPAPAPSSAVVSVAAPYTSAAHPPAAGGGAPAAAFSSAQSPFELQPDTAEEADLMRRMRERLAAVQAAQANLDQRGGAPGAGAGSSYYSSRPSRTSTGGALG